jgi:ribosomal protein S18 acetylase RimI-like enzyme
MDTASSDIGYALSTATAAQIEGHLHGSSADFVPSLESRLDIPAYALKIKNNAETFEAWADGKLAGLVAMYLDDARRTAFITNVSVLGEFAGLGVASTLMRTAIEFARSRNCIDISLQVDLNNHRAVALYRKFNFQIEDEKQNPLTMVLGLN